MGPAPASVVSSVAWLRLEESLPPLEENVIETGRLSGLAASQEMVERSPTITVAGAAEHVILGRLATVVSAGGAPGANSAGFSGAISGAALTSMSSTPSPM